MYDWSQHFLGIPEALVFFMLSPVGYVSLRFFFFYFHFFFRALQIFAAGVESLSS